MPALKLLTGKKKTAFRSTGRLIKLFNWIGSQKAAVVNSLLLLFKRAVCKTFVLAVLH